MEYVNTFTVKLSNAVFFFYLGYRFTHQICDECAAISQHIYGISENKMTNIVPNEQVNVFMAV